MAYKLLGMLVWKGAKVFLRRKVSSASPAKPLLAGGALVALVALIVLAQSKRSTSGS